MPLFYVVFLISGLVIHCSAQWARWDDTEYCYPKVSANPEILCCQGVVYSDPGAYLVCCKGKVCDLRTGKPVSPSSLQVVSNRKRPAAPVELPVLGQPLILPHSAFVRPLQPNERPPVSAPSRRQPGAASRPSQAVNFSPLLEGEPELIRVGQTGEASSSQPEIIRVGDQRYPVRPIEIGQTKAVGDSAQVMPMVQSGTISSSSSFQANDDASPIRVQSNKQAANLPVFLEGPNPMLKLDAYFDATNQKQMPSSYGRRY